MTGAAGRLRGQAGQNPPPQPLPLHKGEGLRAAQALRGGHMPPPRRGEGVRGWDLDHQPGHGQAALAGG